MLGRAKILHHASFVSDGFIVTYLKNIDNPVDLIVIPRSASSLRVSVYRASPARAFAMIPALDTRESVSVVFPWSTCAITLMDRMLFFRSMMERSLMIQGGRRWTVISSKVSILLKVFICETNLLNREVHHGCFWVVAGLSFWRAGEERRRKEEGKEERLVSNFSQFLLIRA